MKKELVEELLLEELYRIHLGVKRDYYFSEEVAAILGIDTKTIDKLAMKQEIPAVKIGHWYLIPSKWLDDIFERMEKIMNDNNSDEILKKLISYICRAKIRKYIGKERRK
jgi:excisionase family DNA binding protein